VTFVCIENIRLKIISNVESEVNDDALIGVGSLMHFCFDVVASHSGSWSTVAVTCPRKTPGKGKLIHKCCPPGKDSGQSFSSSRSGQSLSTSHLNSCAPRSRRHHWWLPINGHLYGEEELLDAGVLVYNASKVGEAINAATE